MTKKQSDILNRQLDKHLKEFKSNCSRKGDHMNYDGKKKSCGWATLLKRNNNIERIFIPIAEKSGTDVDVFIDEILNEYLENIKIECTKNNLAKETTSFRKNTFSTMITNMIEKQE